MRSWNGVLGPALACAGLFVVAPGAAEAQVSPWPDQPCPQSRPTAEQLATRAAILRDLIRDGILTRNTRDLAEAGYGSVFDGSFDWHSCVHAHWALLSIGRVTRDLESVAFVERRLSREALEQERRYLAKHKRFEVPYGQAWLLLLLKELSRGQAGLSPEALRLREETEARILRYLEEADFPDAANPPRVSDPRQEFRGDHFSWLFTLLLLQMSGPTDPAAVTRIEEVRRTKLEPVRSRIPGGLHTDYDFLFVPAVLAMVDRTNPREPSPPPYPLDRPPPLFPIGNHNAHTPGAAMVRIWPFAFEASRGNAAACARYNTRMNEMFARPDQWRDDFDRVSHWVPQFMWMAMWLEQGQP